VIYSDIDALILAAPPWLRPDHVRAAVRAGRHVYCEKPAAVDAAGVAHVLAACSEARQRGLSFVSGLCLRRHEPTAETVARIRAGGVGRPLRAAVHARLGLPWRRPAQPGWTSLEADVRNWISSDSLSGGHFVEHHIHAIDRAIWALGDDWPSAATPLRGGAGFTGTAVRFLYDDGRFIDASIDRREGGPDWIEERVNGTAGLADLRRHTVNGWRHEGSSPNAHQACASAFIHSVRTGAAADDGDTLCRSTLAAIMGRTASVTGKRVEWRDLEAAAGITGRYDRYNCAERVRQATIPPIPPAGCAAPA
jgi:predicted dehydrogenase